MKQDTQDKEEDVKDRNINLSDLSGDLISIRPLRSF
jgi:hypothetical protein